MPSLLINCDYYFRRRLEKVKDSVGELMVEIPSPVIAYYGESEKIEDRFEEISEYLLSLSEEINDYIERASNANKEVKYFLEDLEAAISSQ